MLMWVAPTQLPNKHAYALLRCSVLAWQPFKIELPPSEKFVQLFNFWMQKALNYLKVIDNWQKCMDTHAWMSRIFSSGVKNLQLVVLKFTMEKEAVGCQFLIRQSWRLRTSYIKIGEPILVPEFSWCTIHRILKEKVQYQKVCARWVPHMLTEDHKWQWAHSSCNFLCRYADKKNNFLDSIVMVDPTRAFYFTPETKRESRKW